LSPIIPHAVTAPIISCRRLRGVRAKTAPTSPGDAGIGTALIGTAHAPGLTVVADGVETEEQLALIEERGCDEYQGFLFSRPVAPEQWTNLFERSPAKTES
jgi:EAL domain-containing protein (putative c-di-GMP-specific phosphodiesterase class I)